MKKKSKAPKEETPKEKPVPKAEEERNWRHPWERAWKPALNIRW